MYNILKSFFFWNIMLQLISISIKKLVKIVNNSVIYPEINPEFAPRM